MLIKRPEHVQGIRFKVNQDIQDKMPAGLLETDESYTLIITETDGVQIEANQYSGIVRAISTLTFLVQESKDQPNMYEIPYAPLKVNDSPRYPYRGFMADTSRHYLSVDRIKELIYTISLAKFNIFHWHIVDDDSFPMELSSYPSVTKNGAFSADKVYTKA